MCRNEFWYVKGGNVLIKNLKKLINRTVYENAAEYPWARFKDFIISADGKSIEKIVIASESLIPIPYAVKISDFETIGEKKSVLRSGVKPVPLRYDKTNPYVVSNIKKYIFKNGDIRRKILDMSFDTEVGEIVDFIIASSPFGKKTFLRADDYELGELMTAYLGSKDKP